MCKFLYICTQGLCTYAYTIDKEPNDEDNTLFELKNYISHKGITTYKDRGHKKLQN